MNVIQTELPGVVEIVPARHGDERGWFRETWNRQRMLDHGLDYEWVQDNESLSTAVGTLRGIHFQVAPTVQAKLVRVVAGRIFDVAVDLRRSSPSFGRWVGVELDATRGNQLLVPEGFGHGFVTLEANCHVAYKVSNRYDPDADRCAAWNDPTLAIDWPVAGDAVTMSAKDRQAPRLDDATELFD